ncbi:hypothetical protein JQ629_25185 [Bradyrhizobium sp. AUGA SZCCT0222]|uniref:hypothetical protein n=1 Tax=Bradyrhizobium sp. AUGA SZCCT0222 TaxID=2807668 RepID=UPI001BA68918|nr:hypothetical protein [Bradyrhizobium sp. AUGA SZCCT0222]MBR1270774.1 hypothetical protein [Bradyrhizobium sp. AUGA SZCCT0222]
MRLHVEKQMMHLERLSQLNERRVVFVGSSSVVNGFDEGIAAKTLNPLQPRNLGLTALLAHELPGLRSLIETPQTDAVVYLYNGFSFPNVQNPDAIETRGNVLEDLKIEPIQWWQVRTLFNIGERTVSETLWARRYRNLLISYLERLLRGTLSPLEHPFDYPVERQPPPPDQLTRKPQPPEPLSNWLRKAYVESGSLETSRGYDALRSFCDAARHNGTKFIISPVPEAAFGRNNSYAVGVSFGHIDQRVARIASECGAAFINRDSQFENDDRNFVDEVHLSASGRNSYTSLISEKVGKILRR